MLGDANVCATLAVKDLAAGRQFYEQVLGLSETIMESDYAVVYKSGDSALQVYPSQFAGTNQATAATWQVDDLPAVVADLKQKGVVFEHYDNPGIEMEGEDIHVMGNERAVWFKDPDGNILCIHAS
ncbi:MAG TPA: VOC family protein [Candidatus Microsaccharimonas sp.]|nr:VOC family protein [Candidatus Microsaccharimonas sp.]